MMELEAWALVILLVLLAISLSLEALTARYKTTHPLQPIVDDTPYDIESDG